MKIEITDRAYWQAKVQKAIFAILRKRREEDAKVEAEFARHLKKPRWRRVLFGPSPEMTEPNWDWAWDNMREFYPSEYAWGTLATLRNFELALNTQKTGALFVSEKELKAVGE